MGNSGGKNPIDKGLNPPGSVVIRLTFAFSLLLGSVAAFGSSGSFESAVQARQMLGSDKWSQAIRIVNTNPESRYPSTVYATVFEYAGILWFYTDSEGTQPLYVSQRRIARHKANLQDLLRTIDVGFESYVSLPTAGSSVQTYPKLKNGCVVESIYSFDLLRAESRPVNKAKLLLYTSRTVDGLVAKGDAAGHCVLVFETPEGRYFIDPSNLGTTGNLDANTAWNPVEIAQHIESAYSACIIQKAVTVPCESAE